MNDDESGFDIPERDPFHPHRALSPHMPDYLAEQARYRLGAAHAERIRLDRIAWAAKWVGQIASVLTGALWVASLSFIFGYLINATAEDFGIPWPGRAVLALLTVIVFMSTNVLAGPAVRLAAERWYLHRHR